MCARGTYGRRSARACTGVGAGARSGVTVPYPRSAEVLTGGTTRAAERDSTLSTKKDPVAKENTPGIDGSQ
jgi:hypothetical protein